MTEPDIEIQAMELVTEFLNIAGPHTQGRFLAWLLSRHYPEVEELLAKAQRDEGTLSYEELGEMVDRMYGASGPIDDPPLTAETAR
jgi:hypothetical protein